MVQSGMRTSLSTVTASGRPHDLQLSRAWSNDSEQRLAGAMGEPRGEPSKFQDSGVISGDYSEELGANRDFDIDAMSDGDFSEVRNYRYQAGLKGELGAAEHGGGGGPEAP